MDYISTAQAAEKWGISERRVQQYCIEGRIEGAVRFTFVWAIPQEAPKPIDPRKMKPRTEKKHNKADKITE